ncbi:monocarboxylate transporter 12-B-like isoform X1 [Vespa mandarinia]|uniref:monocarboxylate transporter 12-B-like isoform X1 n=1 Tax=Vespa mandarinia TaxID=7446 RepID=UPI00161EAAC7|nr:monocarboxylate transporter 12-B-like isoform X1 [Vespa mandarinia]
MARASMSSISEITKKEETNKNSKLKDNVGEVYSLMENHSLRIPALAKPPDGGWGWFVVLASFLIHVITDGVTYSFGVFYLELLYYFEEGKGATAWIASILVGVTLCSGPISGSFVNKYGCRAVTIAGSIFASVCLLASVWASSIIMLYFTIGFGTGLGFGLIYLPAIVSVTCYFEKYRSLATGIAVCGSGLGTLIFAPCLESLISNYGWRGAIMICSGIVLNCIILGAFFRPLETSMLKKNHNSKGISEKLQSINKSSTFTKRQESSDEVINPENNIKFNVVNFEKKVMPSSMRTALSQPILINKVSNQHKQSHIRTFGSSEETKCHNGLHHGSLENIRNYFKSLIVDNKEDIIPLDTYSKNISNIVEIKRTENNMALPSKSEKKIHVLQEIMDTSLLKNPLFIIFTLSNFCTSIGFNVPYVYLLPQAEERGINKSLASYLLAIIGVANTLGRIILGYISDKPWINRLLVYNICLTVCGIATILSTFCSNFTAFAFYCIIYGFTAGAYVGLTSVILVDLLGLNRLTNAFGLLLLFQGFASLLGPPVAGWLYDGLASYDPGFYTAGSMIAISGLMLFFIPVLQQKENAKESNRLSIMNSQSA